jgi:two-component system response regulator NreC
VAGYLDAERTAELPAHDALSDSEREVLVRIARGFSNKEIAVELRLSVKTVETYKARMAEKLGLRTRVDIVRYAAKRGWLGDAAGASGG